MDTYELLIVIAPANSAATGVYALPLALPVGTTLETADAIARLYLSDTYPSHQSVRITRRVSGAPTVTLKTIERAARDTIERAPDPIKPEPAPGGERGGSIRFSGVPSETEDLVVCQRWAHGTGPMFDTVMRCGGRHPKGAPCPNAHNHTGRR